MVDDVTREVARTVRKLWWLPVLRGVVLLVLGLLLMAQPEPTLAAIVWLFGIIWIIGAAALSRTRDPGWFWMLASGLVSTLFALLLVARPQDTIGVFAVLLGLFAFVAGALAVVSGFAVRAMARDLERGVRAA